MTRIALYAAGALALLIVLGVVAWNFDPFGRRKAAEARATAATTQSAVDTKTVEAVDHYTHETVVIRERQDRAVQAVQAAPGGDDPIPDAVREAWLKGLAGE